MDDIVVMKILQSNNQIRQKEFCLSLSKTTFFPYMISQISSIKIVHNEIEILSVLKCISHVNNERIF
jgi:hypothetical protein